LLYRPTALQEGVKLAIISGLNTDTLVVVLKILREGREMRERSERREVGRMVGILEK